jgi:hypothetical protein
MGGEGVASATDRPRREREAKRSLKGVPACAAGFARRLLIAQTVGFTSVLRSRFAAPRHEGLDWDSPAFPKQSFCPKRRLRAPSESFSKFTNFDNRVPWYGRDLWP